MRIALVHYHLVPGGVGSVILNQARALLDAGHEVLIVAGVSRNPPMEIPGIPLVIVEGLSYDSLRKPAEPDGAPGTGASDADRRPGEALAAALIAAIEARWGGAADIIHIHNPLIQKNAALIPAIKILAGRGFRFLLQIHDFAEDFRPDVYVNLEEYPSRCHYAVINSRDYSCLRRAGLKEAGLHFVPNEVSPIRTKPGVARKRYLYPVRGIRRKNLGEALLLSLFIPPERTVAVTLPPLAERDMAVYRRWMDLVKEFDLPVEFAVGPGASREEVYGSSAFVITTSIKEGFGFSFLEPWISGREVIGRRIDYVCKDFEEAGVKFKSLYSSLDIPMVYLSSGVIKNKIEQGILAAYKAFGLEVPPYIFNQLETALSSQNSLDFGRLDEGCQEEVLRALIFNQAAFRDIARANPFLADLGGLQEDKELIEANSKIVAQSYGRERVAEILIKTYRSVLEHPVEQKISKSILLELYLDPLGFSPVGVNMPAKAKAAE